MQKVQLVNFAMLLHGDNYLEKQIIDTGCWEPETTEFFRKMLKPGMVVVDVGANIGYFSLLSAAIVRPTGQVHSFEPYPGYVERMKLSLKENNFQNIHLNGFALSDKPQRHRLYKGLASARMNPWKHENPVFSKVYDEVDVECICFDDYAERNLTSIDLIKIDVDGFEINVLRGAANAIKKYNPIIIMEIYEDALRGAGGSSADLLQMFRGWNYLPYSEHDKLYSYEDLLSKATSNPKVSVNVVFKPAVLAMKQKLGLVIDRRFHEENRWCSATTFHLVEALKASFNCIYIEKQKDYEDNLGDVDLLISMEPGWASPILEFSRTKQLRERLSEIASYIFYSDPHANKWRQEYFLKNGFDYILAFYWSPFLRHFTEIPREKLVHLPWAIPDHWIGNEAIGFRSQNKICCFGGEKSEAYEVRNWCRGFEFVESTNNSGVENKVMNESEYIDWLKSKDAAIAAGSDSPVYRLTLPKYFEIAAAGSLLFAQRTDDLAVLGFEHKKNCIIFDRSNFEQLAREYLSGPASYLNIRRAGREFIRQQHSLSVRMRFLTEHIRRNLSGKKSKQINISCNNRTDFSKPGVFIGRPRAEESQVPKNDEFEYWYEKICIDSVLAKAKQNNLLWEGRPLEWDAAYEILAYHEFCGGSVSLEQLLQMSNNRYKLLDEIWPKESLTKEKVEKFYLDSYKILPWGHGIFMADHKVQERRRVWLKRAHLLEMLKDRNVRSICDYGAGGGFTSLLAAAMDFERVVHHEYSIFHPYVMWRAERMKAAEQTNCQLEFTNAENPLVLSEPVDAVICNDVAEHVWNPVIMLNEIHAALKPGGLLAWSSYFGQGISCHLHPDLNGKEEQLLQQAGFKRIGNLPVAFNGHCGLYESVPVGIGGQQHGENLKNDKIKITTGSNTSKSNGNISEFDLMKDVLERNQWLSPAEIEQNQFGDLRKLLEHSYKNVPFYRRRFDSIGLNLRDIKSMDDFRRIPILQKSDIQSNLEEMKAINCPADQLIRDATGGSTGEPLIFYRDLNAKRLLHYGFLRFREGWMGYHDSSSKVAFIWGADRDVPKKYPPNQRWLNSFHCTEDEIEKFVDELIRWQPDAIRAYASSLHMVASYIKKKGLNPPRPKVIESAAEKLWPWQRKLAEEVFGCKVYEQYGSREMPVLACECEYQNGMHIFSDLRLIEIIKDGRPATPGEEGSIVITDLINYGMPFIRYEIGDVGVISTELCPCGRGFPLLKEVKGRVTSTIRTPDGKLIHGEYFTHLFYNVSGIKAFQVRQTKIDEIIVSVQPDVNFEKSRIEKIAETIRLDLGNKVNVQWKAVDEIPKTATGKRHFTISDIPVDFVVGNETQNTQIKIPAADNQFVLQSENPARKKILFVVDSPGWAHDFKTNNLMRFLGGDFNIKKIYNSQVMPQDIDAADLVVFYYWIQLDRLKIDRKIEVLARNMHKMVIGICSGHEMEGKLREAGLTTLQNFASGVFVNCMLLYREFAKEFNVPVFYTPNGVDTKYYYPLANKTRSGKLRVGWAGSIKNHGTKRGYYDFIVPAVSSLEGVELVTAAREDKWRGPEEMLEFYRSLDVYICASREEGTPNPCLEAAACGVPLLTTRVGNMPELVKDGQNGFFIERNVKDIANKIKLLRDDIQLRERLSCGILESIKQWDWSVQAGNYRVMFEQMLNNREAASLTTSYEDCDAIQCFLGAQEEFNRERFSEAYELIHKYRSSVKYKNLLRYFRPSNKKNVVVSVIIVTYNRTEDVRKCIESVNKQQNPCCEYEVIVIDNGFTDENIVKPLCEQYIKCPINLGLSEGRNIGVCFSRGKIIAFLDDDALVGPDYISSIQQAFTEYDIYGFRGKVLPKTSNEANKQAVNYDRGDEVFCTFCDQEGNSAFLTEVYLNVNGMDPLLFGAEGTDLTYRIIAKYKSANKIIYWPKTVIYHDNAPQDIQADKQKRYDLMRQYFYLKHDREISEYRKEIEEKEKPQKRLPDLEEKQIQISPKQNLKNTDVPVALITYNRPKHTYEVLKALKEHNIKNIYIFSDGPKKEEDVEKVAIIRKLAQTIDWTKPKIIEQPENVGLARNIVGAADHILAEHDRLIVLEDDCVPQKYFFDYMNGCLERYEDNEKVFGISGYTVQIPEHVKQQWPYDLYFYPRMGSCGWATWKRAWQHREKDLKAACERAQQENIDISQGGNDVPVMIEQFLAGQLKQVWTLNWVLTVYLHGGCYVYPVESHIKNIGFDGSGVHPGDYSKYESQISVRKPQRFPEKIIFNEAIYNNFRKFYDRPNRPKSSISVPNKVINYPVDGGSISNLKTAASKPLKIVHVCTHDHGGAGKAAYRLHKALQSIGHESSMLVISKKTDDPSVHIARSSASYEEVYKRNQMLLMKFPNRPAGLEMYSDNFSAADLAAEPLIQQADIVNLHWVAGMLNYNSIYSALKNKVSVWTLHDMNPFTGGCHYAGDCEKYKQNCGQCFQLGSNQSQDLSSQVWQQKKQAYDRAEINIVTPSRWLAECSKNSSLFNGFNTEVIPNSLPIDIYKPYAKNDIRKALNIREDAKVILFGAGSLVNERKGFRYLLEAIKSLELDTGSPIYLATFGGMPKNFQIESKYPVYNFGHVSQEKDLALLYSMADVFVLPSLEDNLPNIILEAMACGTPVVSFQIGGIPDMVEHQKTGYLAKPRDINGLNEGIKWVLSAPSQGKDLSRACREKVEQLYTHTIQARAYENLYKRLSRKISSAITAKPASAKLSVEQDGCLVTAVVSTYNSERFIRGCLEDLENQTIADRIEIIVVNSGSQQNEESIVKEFQQRYDNIKYIKTEQRETIYQAWNRAIEAASGKYITIANTDDRRRKDAIEVMVNILEANQDIALVYADQYETSVENQAFENVTVSKENIYPNFEKDVFVDLGWCNIGSQPMWRAQIHKDIGNFDGNFEIAGDYDFLLRVCEKYECFHISQVLGTFYRSAGKTVSCSNTFRLSRLENPLARARSLVRKAIKCVEKADYSEASEYLHTSMQCWPSKEAVEYLQIAEERTGQKPNGGSDIKFDFLTSVWDWPKEMSAVGKTAPVVNQFSDDGSSKYLLSVIISEYKSAEEIDCCLEDLAKQNISNKIEILAASKQIHQYHQVLEKYAGKFANLECVEISQDENIWTGINRALQKSSGEFVTILKPAYKYGNNGLDKMIEIFKRDISKAAVYTCIANGDAVSETAIKPEDLFAEDLNSGRLIWRRCLHNQLGWFDENFYKTAEYEFWQRIAHNYSLVRVPNILESCPIQNDEYDFDMSFERGLIKKAYQYAGLCKIQVGCDSISGHEVFSRWFEVSILKKRMWEKVNGKKYNPVRQVEDLRPSDISALLSVIIVTCDRNKALMQNLDALSKQSEGNFEVIIVNNGSSVFDIGESNGLNACRVDLDKNYGPSLARNIGAEHSRSPYLVFLDDDAVPNVDYVRNIIAHFRQKNIFSLRGKILSPVGGYVPDMYDLGDEIIPYAADMEGNCAFKKEVFNRAGGFSEWLFHGEGMDLSYRIYKQEGEDIDCMLYCPDVIIYHQPYGNQLYRLERILRTELMEKLVEENNPGIKSYQNYMFNFYPINRKDVEHQLGRLFNNAAFLLDKKPQKALEWAKLAMKNFPNVFGPRFILGSAYLKIGDFQNAKKELLELFFGMEDLFAQDTPEAKELLYDKNEGIKEMYLQTAVRLSQCCSELGDYNTIKIVYEKALQNTQAEIPARQRSGMENLLRRLKSMPLQKEPFVRAESQLTISRAMPQKEYLVSAIISTYNAESLIRGCLEDLERQTIADKLEIIVVNSGSQQNEEAIVKEFQSKYDNIVYIRTEQREGIYTAWNRAVKAARGRFLTNANTDDRHRRDALEVLSQELLNNPLTAIVYGDQIYTDTHNCTFENHHVIKAEPQLDYTRERLLLGCCIGSQPMWRKSLHDELGYFDETLDCASDWDFWLRVSEKYPLKRIPEFLGVYYYNQQGIEHGRERHGFYERYIVGKRYGTPYISSLSKYEEKEEWLVSVIMPAYNGEKYIREAIESVLIQNYRNFELIIINDGSTDSTEEIIHSYKDEHIKYFKQENRGLSAAYNEGIRKSSGEFIAKVDVDDFIAIDFIGRHLNGFYNYPDADLIYCQDYLIDEDGEPIRIIKRPEYTDNKLLIRDLFSNGYPVVPFRTCIKKSVFDRIGLFDESLRMAEDYDMMRRFVRAGLQYRHLRAPLYNRRMTKDSLSRKYTEEKIRIHFGVWRKFLEEFSYDELFPDVPWETIPQEQRQMQAKCLAASIAIKIGQSYMDTNVPLYTAVGIEEARGHLQGCMQSGSKNSQIEKLMGKCRRLEQKLRGGCLQVG